MKFLFMSMSLMAGFKRLINRIKLFINQISVSTISTNGKLPLSPPQLYHFKKFFFLFLCFSNFCCLINCIRNGEILEEGLNRQQTNIETFTTISVSYTHLTLPTILLV